MPTLLQLARFCRIRKKRRNKVLVFQGAPHRKGVVYKISIFSPRKPNSAKRKIAKVRVVVNYKRAFAKIPGIGPHFLQEYSVVMLEGGRGPKDTPGVNYSLIRGLCDFNIVETFSRRRRRSKFGVKNAKKIGL